MTAIAQNTKPPRVSVAMPAYNCERYIRRAIESLLAQTFTDFELVISDNASTDSTGDICKEYAARDSRVRYVRREDNIGGPGNFCYVFALCRGEYHKWSTADDYWDATWLERSVAVLDSHPDTVLCYTKTTLIDANDKVIEQYQDPLHLQQALASERFTALLENIGLCNAHLGLIRRSALERTRLITRERASDVQFLAELALYGKFWLIPEYLFFRRYHQQSSSWKRENSVHQQQYYDPSGKHFAGLHGWRRNWRLISSAWRAPIAVPQKVALTCYVAKLMRWQRGELSRELLAIFHRA
jgi:glycosyltransferase involved in cell wall biosynthesis